jgi:hypothetical protein
MERRRCHQKVEEIELFRSTRADDRNLTYRIPEMDSQRKSHLHSFFLRYFHDYGEVDKDLFEEQKCDPGDDQLFEGIIRRDFCYWELLNPRALNR